MSEIRLAYAEGMRTYPMAVVQLLLLALLLLVAGVSSYVEREAWMRAHPEQTESKQNLFYR